GAATVAAGAVAFVFSAGPFSAAELRAHDRELASRVAYVRGQLDPRHIAVLAREDYLLIRYYLPEYSALFHDPAPYVSAPRRGRRTGRACGAAARPARRWHDRLRGPTRSRSARGRAGR